MRHWILVEVLKKFRLDGHGPVRVGQEMAFAVEEIYNYWGEGGNTYIKLTPEPNVTYELDVDMEKFRVFINELAEC